MSGNLLSLVMAILIVLSRDYSGIVTDLVALPSGSEVPFPSLLSSSLFS